MFLSIKVIQLYPIEVFNCDYIVSLWVHISYHYKWDFYCSVYQSECLLDKQFPSFHASHLGAVRAIMLPVMNRQLWKLPNK